MANNKVQLSDGTVLIDLSQDTVTSASDIVSGKVGHLADGSQVTGTASGGGGSTFDIKFTVTYDETTGDPIYSCNKTSAEILTEYQASGYDNMRVTMGGNNFPTRIYIEGEFIEGELNNFWLTAYFLRVSNEDDEMYAVAVSEYYDPETQEDVVTYEEKVYTLTPSE